MSEEFVRKDLHDEQIEHIKDAFTVAVQDMDKRIDDIHSFIGWSFALLGGVFVAVQIGLAYFIYYLQSLPH